MLAWEAGEDGKASSSWHEFTSLNCRVFTFLFAKCRNSPSLSAESGVWESVQRYKKHSAKEWLVKLQQGCPVCFWKTLVGECVLKYIKKKKKLTFRKHFMLFVYGTQFCCISPIARKVISAFCCSNVNAAEATTKTHGFITISSHAYMSCLSVVS